VKNINKQKKPDWSKGHWYKAIVEQRKFLWSPHAVKFFASWMELKQGMTAVDVGCGLGYLGYTYWPYFGKEGHYIGVDQSEKLLKEAKKGARIWARGGDAEFKVGDAYNLPFDDNYADWVMCQTLLMHLENPDEAIREMIRILKPGGLLMCKEPDNLSAILGKHFNSAYQFTDEDHLLQAGIQLAINRGRIKLGRGDQSIGNKIPHILSRMGMREIDVRMNEQTHFLEPPYESEEQKHLLKILKRQHSDTKEDKYWIKQSQEELLAGGGDVKDFRRWLRLMKKFHAAAAKQHKRNEYASCSGRCFFIIKARKPKAERKKSLKGEKTK
jgi:SAM-dependent methyltransferase